MDLFLQLPMLPAVTLHMFGVARTPEGKFTEQTSPTCHFWRENVSQRCQRSWKDPEKIQLIFWAAKVMMWVEAWNPQCFWSSCRSLSIFESTMLAQSHQLYLASCVFPVFFCSFSICFMPSSWLKEQRPRTPVICPSFSDSRNSQNVVFFHLFSTQSSACHLILRQSA